MDHSVLIKAQRRRTTHNALARRAAFLILFLGFPPGTSKSVSQHCPELQEIHHFCQYEEQEEVELKPTNLVVSILHSCFLFLLSTRFYAWPVLESTRTTSNGLPPPPPLLLLLHKPLLLLPLLFPTPILLRSSSTTPAAMPPMRY